MSARRLFLALWPTAAMQGELAAAARAALASVRGGREVPRESLHLTLAFLGSVPESSVPVLRGLASSAPRKRAGGAAPSSLGVTLDVIDYWPQSQVLCATASRATGGAAAELAESLEPSLTAAGFSPDLKPFRAHVTLARQVRGHPVSRQMAPVTWTFSDFALVESRTGPGGSLYSIVERWPLCRE